MINPILDGIPVLNGDFKNNTWFHDTNEQGQKISFKFMTSFLKFHSTLPVHFCTFPVTKLLKESLKLKKKVDPSIVGNKFLLDIKSLPMEIKMTNLECNIFKKKINQTTDMGEFIFFAFIKLGVLANFCNYKTKILKKEDQFYYLKMDEISCMGSKSSKIAGGLTHFNGFAIQEKASLVDFVSAYPNIITNYNLSPETTLIVKESVEIGKKITDFLVHLKPFRLYEDNGTKTGFYITNRSEKNVLPKIVKKLLDLRQSSVLPEEKTLYKLYVNSLYGHFVKFGGEYRLMAAAITSICRSNIVSVCRNICTYPPILIATDGFVMKTCKCNQKCLENVITPLKTEIIERAVFVSGVNYYYYKENELFLKGVVKSDSFKKVFAKVYEKLLDEKLPLDLNDFCKAFEMHPENNAKMINLIKLFFYNEKAFFNPIYAFSLMQDYQTPHS